MPKLAAGADSSQGDFAAIGDQHPLHRSPPSCAVQGRTSNVTLDKFILQDVLFRFLILPYAASSSAHSCRMTAGLMNGGPLLAEQPAKTFPTVKAVAILEAMATARRPLGVSELGALLGLPKPTAHRIVRMLETEGLLQREPGSRRFVPGARMVQLGLGIVAASMLRGPRHAILEALSQKIGETCNFGVMTGSHVVYLDRVESAWPFGLRFEPGSRVPLHCTSMGKLFLSQLPAKKARSAASIDTPLPVHRKHHHRCRKAGGRARDHPSNRDFD